MLLKNDFIQFSRCFLTVFTILSYIWITKENNYGGIQMKGLSNFKRMISIFMIYALKLIKPSDTKRIKYVEYPRLTNKSL